MSSLHCNGQGCEAVIVLYRNIGLGMMEQVFDDLHVSMFSCAHEGR